MDILEVLAERNGYWKYSGGRYLAELTSGKVSDIYINMSKVTNYPRLLQEAAKDLVKKSGLWKDLQLGSDGLRSFDTPGVTDNLFVCGPAMGGVTLAFTVAEVLKAEAIFAEPVYEALPCDEGDDEGYIPHYVEKTGQKLKRFTIPEGTTVLFVEDVITTGKSTREMIEAVCKGPSAFEWGYGDGWPLDYVLCLVNRSGQKKVVVRDDYDIEREFEIISLAEVEARTWDTTCAAEYDLIDDEVRASMGFNAVGGLEAVRPKDNWDLLTKGECQDIALGGGNYSGCGQTGGDCSVMKGNK